MLRQVKSVRPLSRSPVISLKLKDYILCLLSAALLVLPFFCANLWILAWFGFIPLFFALKNKSPGKAFLLAYLTGLIFWSGTIYWLAHVTLAGTILLILYLALYFAIFGLLITNYELRITSYGLLFIPSVWVLLEYVRGWLFTGFPWALLGYSQYLNLPVIQIADISGAWGVSFLVMLVNVAIYSAVGKIKKITPAIIILFFTLTYGYFKLLPANLQTGKPATIRVSVIQGNIPQELKWDNRYDQFILDKYAGLTMLAAREYPDLIVWPEAAAPGILGENDEIFQKTFSLVRKVNIPLVTGAVIEEKGLYFGSALLIDGAGEIAGRYDKLHLVPFGEYIPLKKQLPFLETVVPIGDIERGKTFTIFSLPTAYCLLPTKFAVLDCFEDVFPGLAGEFTRLGADLLINITNDAWYKETSAPWQHLQASVFRAVENRRPVARAANTGISCFISPEGRIISMVTDKAGKNTFVSGYKTHEIEITKGIYSFYTRYGDIFIVVCLLIILYGIISKQIKRA